MWSLYEELLEPIPKGIRIEKVISGAAWSFVQGAKDNQIYSGMAAAVNWKSRPALRENWQGEDLKDLANQIFSWNFEEASLALAAINAYYQSSERIDLLKANNNYLLLEDRQAFQVYAQEAENKKIAFIGHFQNLENYFRSNSEVIVLERRPQEGDYPDSACEYLLPQQDLVIITASSLINKTLVRSQVK